MNSRNNLNDFVSKNSKYFICPTENFKLVKYLRAEKIPNKFDGGKTDCIRYILEVDGVEQSWDRGSRALAQLMTQFEEGTWIVIKKEGEGNQTKYYVFPEEAPKDK